MSYADLGETGPLVLDMPPRMQGILLDFWQRPIPGPQLSPSKVFAGDVGFFGPDGGKGGKFLILPPGYNDAVPAGYYVFRSGTKNVFVFLRAFYEDPKNLVPAVELLEKARFYPLRQEGMSKPMQFPNAALASLVAWLDCCSSTVPRKPRRSFSTCLRGRAGCGTGQRSMPRYFYFGCFQRNSARASCCCPPRTVSKRGTPAGTQSSLFISLGS
jgi:Protein of unknown function (DUF1254)